MNNEIYKYVFPLPETILKLDQSDYDFLNLLKEKYSNHTEQLFYSKKDKITGNIIKFQSAYSSYWIKDSDQNYSSNMLFKKISNVFKNTHKHHDNSYVYNYSQIVKILGSLAPHTDFRSCVLTIPLGGQKDPCHWYDENGNELAIYYHGGPAILKVDILHGVPENSGERVFFQVGGFNETENFDILIKKIKGTV